MPKTRLNLLILTLALCAVTLPAYGVIPGFRGYTALVERFRNNDTSSTPVTSTVICNGN